MTRKEAMCFLHNPEDEKCYSFQEIIAYKMAIKALEWQDDVLNKYNNLLDCLLNDTNKSMDDILKSVNDFCIKTLQGFIYDDSIEKLSEGEE